MMTRSKVAYIIIDFDEASRCWKKKQNFNR